MSTPPCIAILPFAVPEWRHDQDSVLVAQGMATLLEGRLRLIPGARVYVQHLMLAQEEESKPAHFVVRSSMWPLEEALDLPSPEGAPPTHLLQGSLRLGDRIELQLELIDAAAAYVSHRESIVDTPGRFLERLFAELGVLAATIHPALKIDQRLVIARQPTASFEALRAYLVGIARRIQHQVVTGSASPALHFFEPFQKALSEDPTFLEPCLAIDVLAQDYLAHRRDEAVAAVLREAARKAPHYVGFRRTLGVYLFDEGRLDEARHYLEEYLEQCEERAPAAAAAYVRLAAIYHQSDSVARATELLRTAIERFPDNPDVRESLGVCLAEMGRTEEAEACWRAVLEKNPRRATSLSNLAVVSWRNGEEERADALFTSAIDAPDAGQLAFSRYVEFLLEKDKMERADQVATERVERFPENWRHWLQLAHIRRRLGQYSAAEFCLDQAEGRTGSDQAKEEVDIARFALEHPGEFPLYIAAVHTTTWPADKPPRDEQERHDCLTSAVSLLRGLTDRHPAFPFLWKVMADRLAQLGQYESAISAQERYLRLVPASAPGHNMLAGLLLKADRRAEAVAAFRRAVDNAADPTVYRTNLATILVEEGAIEEAEALLDAAAAEKPSDFVVALLREKIEARRRQVAEHPKPAGMLRRLLRWMKPASGEDEAT